MGLLKRFMGVKEGTSVKHGSMWGDFFSDVDRVDKTIEIEYNSQMPYDGAEPNILENQGRLEGEGVVEKKKTFSGV